MVNLFSNNTEQSDPTLAQGFTPDANIPRNVINNEVDGQEDNPAVVQKNFETYLDSLPDEQKAYVVQYLTPETHAWAGLLMGSQAIYDYLAKYVDPNKSVQVIEGDNGIKNPANSGQVQPTMQGQPPMQNMMPTNNQAQATQPAQGMTPTN